MICPDFDTNPELIKLNNEYSNSNRDNLAIEIYTCD